MKRIRFGKVTQLAFFPSWFPVNCYLVEEQDGVTLIDAGMAFFAQGMIRAIEESGRPIARILLTHAHPDHVGALPALKRRFPEAPIYLPAREARMLAGDLSLDPDEAQVPLRGKLPKMPAPDYGFSDGERIGSLTAVACPGHSPGHMAFLHEESGMLIAGDAFQTRGRLAVSGHLVASFPFPAWSNWHAPTSIESARRLAALSPSRLAVGHGPVLERPGNAMDQAIAAAEHALAGRTPR